MIDLWLPPKPAIIRPASRGEIIRARRPEFKQASFLPGFFPAAIASSTTTPPSIAYVGITKAAPAQNFTLNSVSIGAAAATRRVIAVVAGNNSVGHRTISSFTYDIGGGAVSMGSPNIGPISGSTFVSGDLWIYSQLIATGTTANFALSFSGTNVGLSLAIFQALNETSSSPFATMSDNTLSGAVLNSTINIPQNGWVLAAANCASSGITDIAWSGVTESVDDLVGTSVVRFGAGIEQNLTAQTGRAVSATMNGTPSGGDFIGMSWG